jgi:hypothetical protein
MSADAHLNYEDVLDYLGDREGQDVYVGSHPTFTGNDGPEAGLGLHLRAYLAGIRAVPQQECDAFLAGQVATRVALGTDLGASPSLGLVITRDWFRGATLSADRSVLRITVAANLDATPLYLPTSEDRERTREDHLVYVGWVFTFDFEGSPPSRGRWAISGS